MRTKHHLSRAKATALLVSAFAFASAFAQGPSDAQIERYARKAVPKSEDTIKKASEMAKGLRTQLPDVDAVSAGGTAADPEVIAKRYQAITAAGQEPQLFIAVSFSMPPETLLRLSQQAAKVGAHLVLRGVINNSLPKTAEATAAFIKRVPGLQFDIDPTVFRRFGIRQVPAFVIKRDNQELKSCSAECDASDYFVSVAGDVSLDYALEHFSRHAAAPFNSHAERLLAQLRSAN